MAVNPAAIKAAITAAQKVITDKRVRNIAIGAVIAPLILILMVLSSPLAIFFAVIGGGNTSESVPAATVAADLKNQLSITIQKELEPSEGVDKVYLIVNGNRDGDIIDNSNQVLALFAVDQNMNKEKASQVAMLDEKQIGNLREIYWKMNTVTSEIDTVKENVTTQETDKNKKTVTKTSTITKKIKKVHVNNLSWDEIVDSFNFSDKQMDVLEQMLDFNP